MELVNVSKLGIGKGTVVEDAVPANFKGETQEAGLCLAMTWQARGEGYPEIAETLKRSLGMRDMPSCSRDSLTDSLLILN